MISWEKAFATAPLIAILRGLQPDRALEVAGNLHDAGFRIVEVPLNSPSPLASIEAIADAYGDRMIVGAEAVLSADDVDGVVAAGGRLIVAPNLDKSVGARAIEHGVIWCPGITTPTKAFAALKCGAEALKIFPAEMVSPAAVSAIRAVLPSTATLIVVGGVTPPSLGAYLDAGAKGFGLGSALFKPDYDAAVIAQARYRGFWRNVAPKCRLVIEAWQRNVGACEQSCHGLTGFIERRSEARAVVRIESHPRAF